MRTDLLMVAQKEFLQIYPMGFEDEAMIKIRKRHNIAKLHSFALEAFSKEQFAYINQTLENMIKLVQRASMVSIFEKPKFRDYARSLSPEDKEQLVNGYYECLHGNQELGFNQILDILIEGKMARWSLISTFLYYYSPEVEVFCKPTTVKNIILTFELEGLVYKPRPSYDFYVLFRKKIIEMKGMCDPRIGKDNAAMTGFLMMSMPNYQ